MRESLGEQVERLLDECRLAAHVEGGYPFLPDIVDILKGILQDISDASDDQGMLSRRAGGLGRLVTESYAFSQSRLGSELLDLVTRITESGDR